MLTFVGLWRSPPPPPFGCPFSSHTASAVFTARYALMKPAPCSLGGAPRTVAELIRIFLTRAGEGVLPLWVLRYAWMTSAATPAVSGEDSLVPPNCSMGDGAGGVWKFVQSVNSATFVEHSAQPRSPGATVFGTRGPFM